jgi:hypothetical protein
LDRYAFRIGETYCTRVIDRHAQFVEHDKVAPIQLAVIVQREHPPVVLGGACGLRDEDGFAGHIAVAKVLYDRVPASTS